MTWATLHSALALGDPSIAAAGGCVIAAVAVGATWLGHWPLPASQPRRAAGALLLTVPTAGALYGTLLGFAHALSTWTREPARLWVAFGGLKFVTIAVIAHVSVLERWPRLQRAPQ